eukprot:CAMPEP_0174863904 /NCGR_PEP_ID=MMETSP1114-20130205/57211_1 /TAXON_ID=312471 /ORGANISM="Neobodo designis, Strain CCAP 1951/1" /LENGTH=76 /DNA_ID=CAMNT_0016098981 /DNA_START=12 /DNA_END=238 /DNA_ORIENTATION=+
MSRSSTASPTSGDDGTRGAATLEEERTHATQGTRGHRRHPQSVLQPSEAQQQECGEAAYRFSVDSGSSSSAPPSPP